MSGFVVFFFFSSSSLKQSFKIPAFAHGGHGDGYTEFLRLKQSLVVQVQRHRWFSSEAFLKMAENCLLFYMQVFFFFFILLTSRPFNYFLTLASVKRC